MFYQEIIKTERVVRKKIGCMPNGGGCVYGEVISSDGTDIS